MKYTKEEFVEWLNQHPKIDSAKKYFSTYKSYKDSKLPSRPCDYDNFSWLDIFPKKEYDYQEGIKIIKELGLNFKNRNEWKEYTKNGDFDIRLPKTPQGYFERKKIDFSWGVWLGNGNVKNGDKIYFSYNEVKDYLKNNFSLRTKEDFDNNKDNFDDRVPKDVQGYYGRKGEWIDWFDLLNKDGNYKLGNINYDESKSKILPLNLKNQFEFKDLSKLKKLPDGVPGNPQQYFTKQGTWKGWDDYLKNETPRYEHYSEEEFIEILKNIGIDSESKFLEIKPWLKDKKIVSTPRRTYDGFTFTKISGIVANQVIHKETLELITAMFDIDEADYDILGGLIMWKMAYGKLPNREMRRNILKKHKKSINIKRLIQRIFKTSSVRRLKANQDSIIEKMSDDEGVKFLYNFRINELWYDLINKEITIEDVNDVEPEGDWNTKIHSDFIKEYYEVKQYTPPEGFSYMVDDKVIELNDMQKLIIKRNVENLVYANLSGAGSGKTVGDVVTSRELGSKITVIFALNSTLVNVWKKTIESCYPDSNVIIIKRFKNIDEYLESIDNDKFNYILINYEKMQLKDYSVKLVDKLCKYKINKVTFDESQALKVSKRNELAQLVNLKIRRRNADYFMENVRKINPEVQVSILSATIVVNNISEPKSQLMLLTGKKFPEIGEHISLDNLLTLHTFIANNSVRFNLPIKMVLNESVIVVPGDSLFSDIFLRDNNTIKFKNESYLDDFRKLLPLKLKSIRKYLKKSSDHGGTIIYTHYLDGFLDKIKEFVVKEGFTYGLFIGDDKSGYDKWKKGEVDILIASDPISTGVDGLQKPNDDGPKCADTLIILTLPWTYALYEQLIRRIHRQGSIFDVANIIIPSVEITVDKSKNLKWKPEQDILNRIEYKRKLSKYALDSEIYEYLDGDKKQPKKKIIRSDWLRYINGILKNPKNPDNRKDVDNVIIPEDEKFLSESVVNSELQLSQVYNGKNYVRDIINKPERKSQWVEYQKSRKTKHIKTLSKIILKNLTDDSVVVDAGCGYKAFMKDLLPCEVRSYDILNDDDKRIISGYSIDNLPEETESVDVVIHSQVWEGVDFHKKVKEAHRILKTNGRLYVVQSTTEWERKKEKFQNAIIDNNFTLININEKNKKYFITLQK